MAIAVGNTTDGGRAQNATSRTFSHNNNGNILFVHAYTVNSADLTSVTYNGVAMTRIAKSSQSSGESSHLYYLVNPAQGANNVVITAASSLSEIAGVAASYTKAKPGGVPDASSTGNGNSTSFTGNVTTVDDNCWTVLAAVSARALTAGSGSTARQTNSSNNMVFFDSNGAVTPAGSKNMTVNVGSGGNEYAYIMASFAPLIEKSVSDSGSGSDSTSVTVSQTRTDSGSGADVTSITVSQTRSDSGTGSDSSSVSASVTRTDSGSGADTSQINTQQTASDSGSGADSAATLVEIDESDTATGSDAAQVAALITSLDSGSATEAIDALVSLAILDSGEGDEAIDIDAVLNLSDSVSGTDAVQVLAQIARSDSSSAADAVNALVQISRSDAGTSSEAIALLAQISHADSGTAADVCSSFISAFLLDTTTAVDTLSAAFFIAVQDQSAASELISFMVSQSIVDSVSGSDAVSIVELFRKNLSDSGQLTDEVDTLLATFKVTDAGVGADLASLLNRTFPYVRKISPYEKLKP